MGDKVTDKLESVSAKTVPPPETFPRRLMRFVPLVISGLILAGLLHSFDGFVLFKQANLALLGLAVLISLAINVFFGAYKWQVVMTLSDIRMPYREVFKIWSGLLAMTFFMPFQSGHLLYGFALKRAKNINTLAAFESVGYDKYMSLVGTFTLICIGQFFIPDDHWMADGWVLAGSLAVVAFFLLDNFVLRIFSRFEFIREHSRLIHRPCPLHKKLYLLLISTFYQSSDLISFYLACMCLGVSISFFQALAVFPIVLLLSYVPITFSGFGAREAFIAFFMAHLLTYDQSIASGLLVDFTEYIAPALFGLVFFHQLVKVLSADKKKGAV